MSNKGATSNIIQISTNTNFSVIVRSNTGGRGFTNWVVSPGLGTDKYYWRVLTYKPSTVTWYTSIVAWVYVDTNTPSPVTLIQPVYNDIITNADINYVWTSVTDVGTGITNYRLQITNITAIWSTNIL